LLDRSALRCGAVFSYTLLMISRRAARLIAEAYTSVFSTVTTGSHLGNRVRRFELHNDELRDFLYDEEYADWILYILNCGSNITSERILKDRIMAFHTGEVFTWFKNPYTDMSLETRHTTGQIFLHGFAQSICRLSEKQPQSEQVNKLLREMKAQLELDGYVYSNGQLYQSEASVIDEQEEHSYLENLVDKSNVADSDVIKHHLKLSEEHYLNGKYDDSIANSRKVLDAILKQIAERLYIKIEKTSAPAGLLKNAQQTREYLEKHKLLNKAEREALDKNYGLLSVTGGHPYIAEKDQARLMRHLALTFSQFVLLRYQGFLANNP
jgi:hypothetical protein